MSHETLKKGFLSAQLAGKRAEAVQLVTDALQRGVPAREVQLRVIAEAQREIGRLWELNQVTIAQEHLATAIAHLALTRLYDHGLLPQPSDWTVMLACVEGEQHDFGPRIAADILEAEGYDVRFLGANVPTLSLVDMASRVKPQAICLSATMMFHLPALRTAIAALRARVPDTHLLAGGWAIEQLGQVPEGAHSAGTTALDLLAALAELKRVAA